MICRKCGFQNEEIAKFCRNCGAKLGAPAPAPTRKRRKKNSGTVVFLNILIVLFMGRVAYFLLSYKDWLHMNRGKIVTRKNGVTINGVTWATCNVGSERTFMDNPEDYGLYYTFEDAQRACPAGWRTPTKEEFESLAAAHNIWTTQNGVKGRRFGSGSNTVFLPAAGNLGSSSGTAANGGTKGYYWSSTPYNSTNGYYLAFASNNVSPAYLTYSVGFPIRCVRQ